MAEPNILDALATVLGRELGPAPRPRHPETGCPCLDCTLRDDRLESIAESRKDA